VYLCALLSGAQCHAALDWTIQEAVAGGVQMVQLREKGLSDVELLAKARQVRKWTHDLHVLFVVNDRADIARLVDADGVHLGQDDLPIHQARRIVGPDYLVGVSTHNLAQVRQAVLDGASYIGVGPTFPSSTKDFTEFPGLAFASAVASETSLPAFAIGGVNLENVAQIKASGLNRVAVGDAIAKADDPQRIARQLREALCVS
jgi:thiamine-phosphate pyrophosphorylase